MRTAGQNFPSYIKYMSETTRQFKSQLPKNAAMAALSFLVYSLSAIWLTPYLVDHLGEAAYGLVPLAALFTQYVSVITGQLHLSVNRFLTIEIQKPKGNPNAVFNTAFALYLVLILVQLPLFAWGLVCIDKLFSVPAELRTDALLLLGFSSASFLVSLLGAVFGVSTFSRNRLDVLHSLGVVQLIARLVLIVVAFSMFGPKLRYLGYIDFGLNVIQFFIGLVVWRWLSPELHISFRHIDWKLLGPIFKMSLWTLIKQLGALLYLRTDIWIINRFISPVAAGQYAAILVLVNFIKQIGYRISGQAEPTIMAQFAKGEHEELSKLIVRLVKFTALLLAIAVGILCGLTTPLLGVWLGPNFMELSSLVWILAAPLFVNIGFCHLYPLQTTCNKVKVPALVTLILGVVNVIGSYILGVQYQYGAVGVAVMTTVVLCANDAVFTPIYNSRYILDIPAGTLYANVVPSCLVFLLCLALSMAPLVLGMAIDAWGEILIVSIFAGFAGLVVSFTLLSRSERNGLVGYGKEILGRILPKAGISG